MYFWESVLRIRDVYPGSRILIFTHPGSRISDPGSRIQEPKIATKERGENMFKLFKGSTKIARIAGFRVQSANHYTMELAC